MTLQEASRHETQQHQVNRNTPKPDWLKIKLPSGARYRWLKEKSKSLKLATVCEEAQCPNIGECWSGGTATFMVMGEVCTRGCRFCAVDTGNPNGWLDKDEPKNLAQTIKEAGWEYIVVTSVDRDDLPDGGANHFAECITESLTLNPDLMIEVLIPDFKGDETHLKAVVDAHPHVIAQNIETVERLTRTVRDQRAGYQQTMTCLARIKAINPDIFTKSSIMLGLGETDEEVYQCMKDLRTHGVDILTLGQYLRPSPKHIAVTSYVTPEKFQEWQEIAEKELGFLYCASGPLVRSSYRAGEYFISNQIKKNKAERNQANGSGYRSRQTQGKHIHVG